MRIVFFVSSFLLLSSIALADPRPFTFVYDGYSIGKGNYEYEQWMTARLHKEDESNFQRYDFRHELEIGVADNFDLSIYLPNWVYEDSDDHQGTRFDTVSVEGILFLTNPVTDPIGFALYSEVSVGEHEAEFEQKLLFHKDVGNWTFAYNLILETEIEGLRNTSEENEVEGVLGHALGASYSVARDWRLGAEMTIESAYSDWEEYEGTTVYAGPNASYQSERWWATLTPMFQLSDREGEPDFEIRMIFGYQF